MITDQFIQKILAQKGLVSIEAKISVTSADTGYSYHVTICDLDGNNLTFQSGESLQQTIQGCYERWQIAREGIQSFIQKIFAQQGLVKLDTQVDRTTNRTEHLYHVTICDLNGQNMTFQLGESLQQAAERCYERWQAARAGVALEPLEPEPPKPALVAEVAVEVLGTISPIN